MFERFSGYFQEQDRNGSNKGKRSLFVIIICALVIIIPTLLAVYYAYFYEDDSVLSSNNFEIELYSNEKLLSSEKIAEANITDSLIASLFSSISPSEMSADSLESLYQKPNYTATVRSSGILLKYDCYFNDRAEESYVVDEQKNVYSVSKKEYDNFLNSSFSEGAYPSAIPPTLTTGNGETVLAISGEWCYRLQNGNMRKATQIPTASSTLSYKIGGAVNISFDVAPTSCNVTIYDASGKHLFEGSLEDVAYLTVEVGAMLSAKVHAVWENSENALYHGELLYSFKITVGDRSEFSLSANELYPGQFAVLSATNVDDIEKIVFSARARRDGIQNPAIDALYSFVPKFVRDGNKVMTIIPFPMGLPEMTYTFSVSFGAAEQVFSVNIIQRPPSASHTASATSNSIASAISDSALSTLAILMKTVNASPYEKILFRSSFENLSDYGFKSGYSYQDSISTQDGLAHFSSLGNEYTTDTLGGQAVPALNVGIVIDSGSCAALGNYVVVDHGAGLRTWYCQLSSIAVAAGDILAKGQTVGLCGSGGILSSRGVLIVCTVYETIIDPSFVVGKEITY